MAAEKKVTMHSRLSLAVFLFGLSMAGMASRSYAADDDWDKKLQNGEDFFNKDYLWEAEKIFEQCFNEKKDLKPEDPRYIRIRILMGEDYLTLVKWKQAEAMFGEALAVIERQSGADSPNVLIPVIGLTMCASLRNDHAEAVRQADRAHKVLLEMKEENQLAVDASYHLAEVALGAGLFPLAEECAKLNISLENKLNLKASKFWQQQGGVNDVMMKALLAQNKMVDARDFAQAVVDNTVKKNGKDSDAEAEAYLMLGSVYATYRTAEDAITNLEHALNVFAKEREEDKRPQEIGITHFYLATCYMSKGNIERAKEHLAPAIEGMKNYPARQVNCCELLFQIETMQKHLTEAEAAIKRGIEIDEHSFGRLSINGRGHYRMLAQNLLGQSKYDEAATAFSKAIENAQAYFGEDSESVAGLKAELAYAHVLQGKEDEAFVELHENLSRLERIQPKFLAQLSDHQKLNYIQNSRVPWEYFFSLVLRLNNKNPETALWAHQAALTVTGMALDSAMAQQEAAFTSGNADLEALRIAISKARQQVASLYTRTKPGDDPKNAQRIFETAVAELDKLDAEFAAKSAPYALVRTARTADVKGMQAHLAPGTALITVFPCTRYAFKITNNPVKPFNYMALVMTHDHLSSLIDLGSVADMNAAVGALRTSLYGAAGAIEQDGSEKAIAAVRRLSGRVSELLLKPMWPELKDTQRWLLAFDGELATVPIHILPIPEEAASPDAKLGMVVDRIETSFLNSPRDIMLFGAETTGKGAVILAGPDFNLPVASTTKGETPTNPVDLFLDLPGARDEGAIVANLLQRDGIDVTLRKGSDATKAALMSLKAPRYLHVSTHGYYLADRSSLGTASADRGIAGFSTSAIDARPVQAWLKNMGCPECGLIHDPLMRSGLVFAGANRLSPEESIATARELAGLNLWGTELVVLSACETGEGVSSVGEGVLGLRRSFALSGCQRVITSLWPIQDQATKELMTAFYSHRLKNERTATALRNAMLERRDEKGKAHPFYWAGFILIGDPN